MGVREGGNELYCESVIRALARAAQNGASDDEYFVFSHRGAASTRLPDPCLTHVPLHRRSVVWQRAVELPLAARRLRLDVLHVPYNFLPTGRARKIVTIYDLTFLRFPQTHGAVEQARLTVLTRLAAQRADHVVTVSAASRSDIVERYGVPPNRVTVAPGAVDRSLFRPTDDAACAAFRRQRGLGRDYFLHVGTLHPRKNVPVLIEAFARLRARGRRDHHLVLVGRSDHGAGDVFRTVRARGLDDVVHHLENVDAADLAATYSGATALVLPSLYEGFGLPALEAMSCGCPVLASQAGALPEVCGDAALFFDPRDPDALSARLESLLDDAALRQDLTRRGFANCDRFSWERTAALVSGVYHAA